MRNQEGFRMAGTGKRRNFVSDQISREPCDFSPNARPLARKNRNALLRDLLLRIDLAGRAKAFDPLHIKRKVGRIAFHIWLPAVTFGSTPILRSNSACNMI